MIKKHHIFSLGKKFTVIIYRRCKYRTKFIQFVRDRFFGTGITIFVFLKF